MKSSERIKMALAYRGMSEAKLARALGTSPSAFNQRMKHDKFTPEELERIADVLGAQFKAYFVFPDGTTVG